MDLGGVLRSNFYSAGTPYQKDREQHIAPTVDGRTLGTHGHIIGRIETVFTPYPEHIFYPETFLKTWKILCKAVKAERGSAPSPEFMIRLLTGGHVGRWAETSTPKIFQFHHSDPIIPIRLKSRPNFEKVEEFEEWLADTVRENARRFC